MVNSLKAELQGTPLEKLNSSLSKNPDLEKFVSGPSSFEFQNMTEFAPLVSVDVERSFSVLKNVLTDKRTNFTPENLEKVLVIQEEN